jgi:hypothetical protein
MRPLVLEFRVLYWAILAVIVPFGLLLYFFPSGTDTYWAWTILQPRSAILIGAGYVGAIAYYVMLLRQNDWRQAQNGLGGLVTFCTVLLIATMLHWDAFKAYHFTTLVWLLFYYVGPLVIPIFYVLQQSTSPVSAVAPTIELGPAWRRWLVVRGLFYSTLAIIWLLAAEPASAAWPWPIGALELRVFVGQVAIIGWNGVGILRGCRAWDELRLGLLLSAAIGLVQLVGLSLSRGPYDWSLGLGLLLPAMFAEWLLTPAILWLRLARAKPALA